MLSAILIILLILWLIGGVPTANWHGPTGAAYGWGGYGGGAGLILFILLVLYLCGYL